VLVGLESTTRRKVSRRDLRAGTSTGRKRRLIGTSLENGSDAIQIVGLDQERLQRRHWKEQPATTKHNGRYQGRRERNTNTSDND